MGPQKSTSLIVLKWSSIVSQFGNASKRCRCNDKQCRPWSDCSSGAVWLGSALFSPPYLFQHLDISGVACYGIKKVLYGLRQTIQDIITRQQITDQYHAYVGKALSV